MRTLSTCGDGALVFVVVVEPLALVAVEPLLLAVEVPPACVPPALLAAAESGHEHTPATINTLAAKATNFDRLCAPVLAKTATPSRRTNQAE
jgi:hypothetical protein